MADLRPARNRPDRPLSPHLQIYRFTWTMAMSIAHRITGTALYVGAPLFAAWLAAAAYSPDAYATANALARSWLGVLVLVGFTWACMHHAVGGLRHMVWDLGMGLDRAERYLWSQATLAGSVALTVLIWGLVLWLVP